MAALRDRKWTCAKLAPPMDPHSSLRNGVRALVNDAPTSSLPRADYFRRGTAVRLSPPTTTTHHTSNNSSYDVYHPHVNFTMSMFRTGFSASTRSVVASSSRGFHSTPAAFKVTEKVAEVADKVNKKVGQTLASAIEKGEEATEKTKETLTTAKDKASEASSVAGQKANQTAAGAREGARDFTADVKKEARK
ncbi:hypothetical protein TRAPUB_10255 [Trametes pubescens]|uniref:Uncharacterized protein n=1 Tax=Trametes pubescens TaxID=154538 RepID=A0A1M2W0C0_TRAPU|nr:hypothetical protein TRAPUB_10255 [Trametes pubescens]